MPRGIIANYLNYFSIYVSFWIGIAFIFTGIVNFFSPINSITSSLILILSLFVSFILSKMEFSNVTTHHLISGIIPKWVFYLTFFVLILWIIIVLLHPAIDTDTHVYHLPLPLLMNQSIWYPGIVKINLNFGSPNGASVISSLFTSFNKMGLENATNLLLWLGLISSILSFLLKTQISLFLAIISTVLVVLQPDLFWQSYNMGEDLGACFFLGLGFLSWNEKKIGNAFWLFSLASIFRIFGAIALALIFIFEYLPLLLKKNFLLLKDIKIYLSLSVILIWSTRAWIGTGNPFYPTLPLSFAQWSIPVDIQTNFLNSIKGYLNLDRNILNLPNFLYNLLLFPQKVKGSYFFWPPIFVSLSCIIYLKKIHSIKLINYKIFFTLFTLTILWYIGSPLTRFFLGPFLFLFLSTLSIYLNYINKTPKIFHFVFLASVILTFSAFSFNALKHFPKDIIPLFSFNNSLDSLRPFLSYSKENIKEIYNDDEFIYNQSDTTYCGWNRPPCFNHYSFGDPKLLASIYWKYNHRK